MFKNPSLTKTQYLRWMRAAYLYYISTTGEDSGMTDGEWDLIARRLYAMRDILPKEEYPVLHDERFTGGSIFWLKKEDYPQEVREPQKG